VGGGEKENGENNFFFFGPFFIECRMQ